jgi:hypothetical protein
MLLCPRDVDRGSRCRLTETERGRSRNVALDVPQNLCATTATRSSLGVHDTVETIDRLEIYNDPVFFFEQQRRCTYTLFSESAYV